MRQTAVTSKAELSELAWRALWLIINQQQRDAEEALSTPVISLPQAISLPPHPSQKKGGRHTHRALLPDRVRHQSCKRSCTREITEMPRNRRVWAGGTEIPAWREVLVFLVMKCMGEGKRNSRALSLGLGWAYGILHSKINTTVTKCLIHKVIDSFEACLGKTLTLGLTTTRHLPDCWPLTPDLLEFLFLL